MTQVNPSQTPSVTVVVATNNDAVLRSCLLASPDLAGDVEVVIERSRPSAAKAYNSGLERSSGELLVFVHQDVFLPPGWVGRLRHTADALARTDPAWAVLGVFGLDDSARGRGHLYSTGLQRIVGAPLATPVPVQSLDEVVLVLRRSSGLRFDEGLPGFHLYGTDLCQEARRRGLHAYAFEGFCVHNSNGIRLLPLNYWRAWLYMRKKWWAHLPISTPCMAITRWARPAVRHVISQSVKRALGPPRVGRRVGDPAAVWKQLQGAGAGATLHEADTIAKVPGGATGSE